MKLNTVVEIIRHALKVSSAVFIDDTVSMLRRVLLRSSYPQHWIESRISGSLYDRSLPGISTGRVPRDMKRRFRYVSCPFLPSVSERVVSVVRDHDLPVRIASKPLWSNGREVFARLKERKDLSMVKNAIFRLLCMDCGFASLHSTCLYDVQRTIGMLIENGDTKIREHMTLFPGHRIDYWHPVMVKNFSCLADVTISKRVYDAARL